MEDTYTKISEADAIKRIAHVSKSVKPADIPGVLNYIQFIAIEALMEAKHTVTPYKEIGSPPPPCPGCPPVKP